MAVRETNLEKLHGPAYGRTGQGQNIGEGVSEGKKCDSSYVLVDTEDFRHGNQIRTAVLDSG